MTHGTISTIYYSVQGNVLQSSSASTSIATTFPSAALNPETSELSHHDCEMDAVYSLVFHIQLHACKNL